MSSVATPLGPFPVAGTAAEAAAFAAATGATVAPDRLPLTFPMRWLVAREVRAALLALVPETDLVLVHESQSFDYAAPLHVDRPYGLSLTVRRAPAPDRLFVDATVADGAGVAQVAMETILRLVAAPPGVPA